MDIKKLIGFFKCLTDSYWILFIVYESSEAKNTTIQVFFVDLHKVS